MTRDDVTNLVIAAKRKECLKWADLAKAIGQSKGWVTAGLLGQMTFTAPHAGRGARIADRSRVSSPRGSL
jgi:cyanate lyase